MELREFMMERKGEMTYRAFAKLIGVNFSTLHRFMIGKADLTVPNIRTLAMTAIETNDLEFANVLKNYVGLKE